MNSHFARTYLTIMSLALTTAITATNGIAQQPSATASSSQSEADLDDQFMYQRTVEAVIWSMPVYDKTWKAPDIERMK